MDSVITLAKRRGAETKTSEVIRNGTQQNMSSTTLEYNL